MPNFNDQTSPMRVVSPNSYPSSVGNHSAQQVCQPVDSYLVSYPPASNFTLSAPHGPHVHIVAPHSALRAQMYSMPATASALVTDSRCSSISNVSTASNTSLNSGPSHLRRTLRANLPDHQRTIVHTLKITDFSLFPLQNLPRISSYFSCLISLSFSYDIIVLTTHISYENDTKK